MFELVERLTAAVRIEEMTGATREESAAAARRLAAIGELHAQRRQELIECEFWATDAAEATAAEVSAALNISRGRALTQIRYAHALRDRLPEVAKVFADGGIDFRMVRMIIVRTTNVDDDVIEKVDRAIAGKARRWMRLSDRKLETRIDQWVAKYDPAGVRVPPETDQGRYIDVETTSPGMAGIWATVHATDAAIFDKRLDALAATVCPKDPRTKAQRRADAVGALGRGDTVLPCLCGSDDCPVATERAAASAVAIHVLAEQGTLDGSSDNPGYLPGFGIVPAESVRALAKAATLKPVVIPKDEAEPRYRPSAGLAEFVKLRDLTCRFPGCDAPAEVCEIDHTVPYPVGSTHPSGLKDYCKVHHLVKTFFTGAYRWVECQLPDGRLVLTAPTGHVYLSEPFGAALFPVLGTPTGTAPVNGEVKQVEGREAMMPARRQTRDQDRQDRIAEERRQRIEMLQEQERQWRQWVADTYEPPPF